MSKYLCLFISFLFFAPGNIHSQDRIATDRPDQTELATLTPLHYFQAELGFARINYGNNNYDIIHPNTLLKYGLAKTFELRLEGSFMTQYRQLIPQPTTITGIAPIEPGFRVAICEQKKIIPKTAFIAHVAIPTTAANDFDINHFAPTILFAMENEITKKFGISYNIGAEWDGFSSTPAWLYSLSCGFQLAKKWESFIEIFSAVINNNIPENNVDGGLGFYISNDAKLDAFIGVGLNKNSVNNFFGLGFSFRVK